jgi:hypothetical protein
MILCLTSDDMEIVKDAYSGYDESVFGIPYCYLPGHSYRGLLGQSENLFISAHGNDMEIGNREGSRAYTPGALRDVLTNYFLPGNYSGSIYVSACHSAPRYVNELRAALGAGYARRIFGMFGEIEFRIARPGASGWIVAT